jgi:hypothetical protein
VPSTTRPHDPPVPVAGAPCFASAAIDTSVALGDLPLPLRGVRVGATLDQAPPWEASNGLLMGFLSEEDAEAVIVPGLEVPLSQLLPCGSGNCAAHDDRDLLEGISGWWFYLAHSASEITYSGY